eukprot:3835013-Amphidinium_carterae.1
MLRITHCITLQDCPESMHFHVFFGGIVVRITPSRSKQSKTGQSAQQVVHSTQIETKNLSHGG